MSNIGEESDSDSGSSHFKSKSRQPINAATHEGAQSTVKTLSPVDFNIELKNLKNYDYFFSKMSQIRPKSESIFDQIRSPK